MNLVNAHREAGGPVLRESVSHLPILIVDDESTVCHVIRTVLESHGRTVLVADSAEAAYRHLTTANVSVALIDVVLPKMSGLELLAEARRVAPATEIVVMTSHASLDTAMQAIHLGAYDFVQKPFEDIDVVWRTVKRALDHHELTIKNKMLVSDLQEKNALLAATVSRLTTLTNAGLAMGDLYTVSELCEYVVGLIAWELGAARASVMLVDAEGKKLHVAASRGLAEVPRAALEVAMGEGISGKVAATGRPMLVRDISSDPALPVHHNPALSDSFMSAPIAVSLPIRTRQAVLGVLNVTDRASGRQFGDDDLAFLSAMSTQLALAIERARFVEDLKRANDSLRSAQSELMFSERVKAIGEIAAGVAHDYNNTLGALLARVQLALHKLSGPRADVALAVNDLKIAEKVASQSAATIKRIQDFARRGVTAPQAVLDVNELVSSAVEMTRPKWKDECERAGRRIDVELYLGEVPPIRGDQSDITQALSNLLLNAVDAMPRGGTVRFRTVREGASVVIEISDEGEGIPEEIQERIFQPFYTTKSDGHGLGLSIVQSIVARHGGDIRLASRPGLGTTFRMRLPADTGDAGAARVTAARTAGTPARSARILLVDDLDDVRESCHEMLAAGGHSVTEAAGGREAISMIAPGKFDLIITDLGMPEVSGLEVAAEAKRVATGIPVILLSGWAVDQDEARVKDSGIDRVLPKPCPMADLLAAVDEILRPGASA